MPEAEQYEVHLVALGLEFKAVLLDVAMTVESQGKLPKWVVEKGGLAHDEALLSLSLQRVCRGLSQSVRIPSWQSLMGLELC